jgi:glycosyltransferase involved in cell wall biosynthesis
MRILFFSHYFPPEVNAPASRTFEHCREWVAAGHEVHVITCVPSHPAGVPFPGHRMGWYQREQHEGVIATVDLAGAQQRVIAHDQPVVRAVRRAVRSAWPVDIIIRTSPNFCAVATDRGVPETCAGIELRREEVAECDRAVGAARAYMPLRFLERLELLMYRHARAVVCVSQSFVTNLVDRGIDGSKISFVPNGVDVEVWTRGRREAGRAALCVSHRDVVVSYVGTIGMAHDIGTVLDAARILRDERPDIRFAIVGDGAERQALMDRAAAEGLTNVTFTGLVPREDIPDYLAASEISLVTLRRSDVFKSVLPSKMFESMAAASAHLRAVRRSAAECWAGGAVSPSPATRRACLAVRRLADDPECARRWAARACASSNSISVVGHGLIGTQGLRTGDAAASPAPFAT